HAGADGRRGGAQEADERKPPHTCPRTQRSMPADTAVLAARAAAHPRSLPGPPNSQRRPPPVAATTTASVEVPLARSPSGVRTPASAIAMTLASVTVITRFTTAAGAAPA